MAFRLPLLRTSGCACDCSEGKMTDYALFNYVIPKTVGQYTGAKDDNGREIYEGDIVIVKSPVYPTQRGVVRYGTGAFKVRCEGAVWCYLESPKPMGLHYEVIGNIYDNPELFHQPESE